MLIIGGVALCVYLWRRHHLRHQRRASELVALSANPSAKSSRFVVVHGVGTRGGGRESTEGNEREGLLRHPAQSGIAAQPVYPPEGGESRCLRVLTPADSLSAKAQEFGGYSAHPGEQDITAPLLDPHGPDPHDDRSSQVSEVAVANDPSAQPIPQANPTAHIRSRSETGLRLTSFASATGTDVSATASSEGLLEMKRQLRASMHFPVPFGGQLPLVSKAVDAQRSPREAVYVPSPKASSAFVESPAELGRQAFGRAGPASGSGLDARADERSESGSGGTTPRASSRDEQDAPAWVPLNWHRHQK